MGVEYDAPELDARTQFWMGAFSTATRTRPQSMGGIAPLNPIAILDLRERLYWPAEPEEAVHVLCAIDDEWRRINDKGKAQEAA